MKHVYANIALVITPLFCIVSVAYAQSNTNPSPVTNVTDPSIWVTVLNQAPIATMAIILALVVRHLYLKKEALHAQMIADHKECQVKVEQMMSTYIERGYTSASQVKDALDDVQRVFTSNNLTQSQELVLKDIQAMLKQLGNKITDE